MVGIAQVVVQGKKQEVKAKGTIRDLMKKFGLNPEIHLSLVNGKLKEEDYRLKDGDVVEIIRVISGG